MSERFVLLVFGSFIVYKNLLESSGSLGLIELVFDIEDFKFFIFLDL